MIYLLLAICCSFAMSLLMRVTSKHIENPMAMYMSNYLICILLAIAFAGKVNLFQKGMRIPFLLGGISGAFYLISLQAYDRNLRINGLSMAATFNKLGIIIPEVMAFVLFKETAAFNQIIGLILAIAAIFCMYFDRESMKYIQNRGMLAYLLLTSGICGSMSNIYNNIGPAELKDCYLVFNFCFAFLFSLSVLLIQKKKFTVKDCLIGALAGIPNYLSSRFVLYSLSALSAVVVYPVYNVSVLLLLIVTGVLFFREEMNRKKLLATLMVCAALVLLNIRL